MNKANKALGFLLGASMGALAVFAGALISIKKVVEYVYLNSLSHSDKHVYATEKSAEDALFLAAVGVLIVVLGIWLLFVTALTRHPEKKSGEEKPKEKTHSHSE